MYLGVWLLLCSLSACHKQTSTCGSGDLRVVADFPAARVNACEKSADNHFTINISPENTPINDSPWFAFRIENDRTETQTVSITIKFIDGSSRYLPKVSNDREHWRVVEHSSEVQQLHFDLTLNQPILWVAAQELLTGEDYSQWFNSHSGKPHVSKAVIGELAQGRPINALFINPEQRDTIIILGRQHPPEVTGALALFPFVDTLLADTPLNRAFNQRFNLIVIPNLNPDGVALGNWRNNANGVDTNRDWGLFEQPETKAVANLLRQLNNEGHQFYLGLDFHSTGKNYFYTQEDTDPLCPAAFTAQWIADIQSTLPNYTVKRSARTSDGNPTFKQWFNTEYGVPSISFELDDNVERELIPQVGAVAATAMMKLLLDSHCPLAE